MQKYITEHRRNDTALWGSLLRVNHFITFGNTGVPSGLHFILGDYGFLNPILAAFAMSFSSISVVTNSLRLYHAKIS